MKIRGLRAGTPHFLMLAHVQFPFLRVHAVGIFSDFWLIENEMNVFVKSVVESGE